MIQFQEKQKDRQTIFHRPNYLFYFNRKEKDHINRKINKRKLFICEIIIIILIYQKLRSVGHIQQKIKLPSSNKKIIINR